MKLSLWIPVVGILGVFVGELRCEEILLRDCLLYDGRGRAPMEGASILVRDGRIETVYPPGDIAPPAEKMIDCEGQLVIPGLIDLQTHLESSPMLLGGFIPIEDGLNHKASILAGTTMAVSFGGSSSKSEAVRFGLNSIEAGPVIVAEGGLGPWSGCSTIQIADFDDVDGKLDQILASGGTWAQIIWDHCGWADTGYYKTFSDEMMMVLIEGLQRRGMQVSVWSRWGAHLLKASDYGAQFIVGSPIGEGGFPNKFAEALVRNGTVYVPCVSAVEAGYTYYDQRTVFGVDAYLDRSVPLIVKRVLSNAYRDLDEKARGRAATLVRQAYPGIATTVAEFIEAGLPIAGGSAAGEPLLFHGFQMLRELESWVLAGASVEKAVRAATYGGALVLGCQRDRGSIEEGKRADLVIIDGDPRADAGVFRKVTAVMIDGVILDRETLYSELQPPEDRVIGVEALEMLLDPSLGSLELMAQNTELYDSSSIGGAVDVSVEFKSEEGHSYLRWGGSLKRVGVHAGFADIRIKFSDPAGPWDARSFDGIVLRCRGSDCIFKSIIHTARVIDGNAYFATFVPRGDWGEVRIPFSNFRQPGRGLPTEWTGDDLTEVRIHTDSLDEIDFFLEIEDIQFYRN